VSPRSDHEPRRWRHASDRPGRDWYEDFGYSGYRAGEEAGPQRGSRPGDDRAGSERTSGERWSYDRRDPRERDAWRNEPHEEFISPSSSHFEDDERTDYGNPLRRDVPGMPDRWGEPTREVLREDRPRRDEPYRSRYEQEPRRSRYEDDERPRC
jgi:hypothetical protein